MLTKFAILGSVLCLFSLVTAFEITSYIEDGIPIPQYLNITTGPFTKIGHGYYYIEKKTKRNWFDAYAACRQLGASLIAFDTTEKWNLINLFLWKYKKMTEYWTAGTDLANVGTHVWLSTGQSMLLNLWAPGQPDNYDGTEHCDAMGFLAVETNFNSLNDFPCEKMFLYICEAPQPATALFVSGNIKVIKIM